jgi:hypothetical protein
MRCRAGVAGIEGARPCGGAFLPIFQLVDEASLHFALAGIDDLVWEIRSAASRD